MARFHDEFFKQKGTEHDEMICTIVSDAGLKWVANSLKSFDINDTLNRTIKLAECGEIGQYIAYGDLKVEGDYYKTVQCEYCANCGSNSCGFNNDGTLAYHYSRKETPHDIRLLTVTCPYKIQSVSCSFETEVICKNRDFIIGYADLVISDERTFKGTIVSKYEKGNTLTYTHIEYNNYLIDAKPTLEDMGAVLRQIKTYRAILNNVYRFKGVAIVTKSEVKNGTRKLAANEGVKILNYAELEAIVG